MDEKDELKKINDRERRVFGDNILMYSCSNDCPETRHILTYMDFKSSLPKKNTRFFYDDPELSATYQNTPIILKNMLPHTYIFTTQDQKKILRHLPNPFSFFETKIYRRKLYTKENKLLMKVNTYNKKRELFHRYPKKTDNTYGISLNLKTGDITHFSGTTARKNDFKMIKHILKNMITSFDRSSIIGNMGLSETHSSKINQPVYEKFVNEFNQEVFIDAIFNELKKIDGFDLNFEYENIKNGHTLYLAIVDAMLYIKKIKVPNNYIHLLEKWYPTMKILRKNDNKLIQSILDRFGIKSKKMVKILHENEKIKIELFPALAMFFGKNDLSKYISNLTPKYKDMKYENPKFLNESIKYNEYDNKVTYILSHKEKTNLLKIINEIINKIGETDKIFWDFINSLVDHFRMLAVVVHHYPDEQLRSTTEDAYNIEHSNLSKIYNTIKRGMMTEFIFEEGLKEYLENPIFYNNDMYYPVLLRTDGDYFEEGRHMHHCVGSYSAMKSSIIVSLRQRDVNGNERVTSEFNVENRGCVQSKYFCNGMPPEHFDQPLETIRKRVQQYSGKIKSIEFKEIPLTINGVEVKKEHVDRFLYDELPFI